MKVYHAHAKPTYDTRQEEKEREIILNNLDDAEIVDPGSYENNPKKRMSKDPMKFCLNLVEKCEALVFSRFAGKITAGVGLEANFAFSRNMAVFEVAGKKLFRIKKPVNYLTVLETIRLPGYYTNN